MTDRRKVNDPGKIEQALTALWREAVEEDQSVSRACTLNLVVACGDGECDLDATAGLVDRVAETAPGRSVLIAARDASAPSGKLEVDVAAHFHRGLGGTQICSEQVVLHAQGDEARRLVTSTVLQLLVEEMPVYLLWRRAELSSDALFAPLLDLADRLIVDGGRFPAPGPFLADLHRASAEAGRHARPFDVVWARLEPWREALASFFDPPAARDALRSIAEVEIAACGTPDDKGLTVTGAYVAGWLASRLGWQWRSGRWLRQDARPVKIALRSAPGVAGELESVRLRTDGDEPVTFVARRTGAQGDAVHLHVESSGGKPSRPRLVKLPTTDDAALLCGSLQQAERDPLFEAALGAAAAMA